ncbi:MAG: efflux RND transporter periplasmic adaptor subunit [Planctomycetales bacterium]|nr:efflux RND transporter periplasmic adaptor subunit [Planctomycetales bacterium]
MPPSSQSPTSLANSPQRRVTTLLCCCLLAWGCHQPSAEQPAAAPPEIPTRHAEVVTITPRPWAESVRTQGVLVADEAALVGARVAGSVAKVHVDFGDVVQRGEPLVELDREEFRLQVEQAEAALAQARAAVGLKPDQSRDSLEPENAPPVRQERALRDEAVANLARARELKSQRAIAEAEYEQVVAAEQVAEARYSGALNAVREKIALIGVREVELSLAKQQFEHSVVVAPFDGLVQQRHVALGKYVQVGDAIVTMVRSDPLRFRGTMPERFAQRLQLGQRVRLRIEGIAEPRDVEVTRISPALDQSSRSLPFEAEVRNDDQQLRTGLFAEAEVIVDPDAVALVVPRSALVEFAGAEKVWKIVDGVAKEHEVLAGQRREQGVEILQGLSPGDVILNDGSSGSVAKIEPLSVDTTADTDTGARFENTENDPSDNKPVAPAANTLENAPDSGQPATPPPVVSS